MRFIREMIARKAAGEDEPNETVMNDAVGAPSDVDPSDGVDQLIASEGAGFEDEMDDATPVLDSAEPEVHANADAPTSEFEPVFDDAGDDFDEDAELDALDAAFPDIDPADDTVERLFPEDKSAQPDEEIFQDIPDSTTDEPMPQLTAEDIQRAMKNRKKIWHSLPDDEDDPLFETNQYDDAVTRPIRRPSAMRGDNPVSVPLELINPVEAEEAPAMEAPKEPAEMAAPEMASMIQEDFVAEEPEAAFEAVTTEPEEAEAPELAVQEAAVSEPVEVVVDDVAEDEGPEWPQPAGIEEPVAQTPEPVAEAAISSPDIQALMARAALEAAGAPVPPVSNDPDPVQEPAKPTRRGRVKTRLLGFQPDEPEKNIFETAAAAETSEPDMFPVGWMVVIKGPGRGASFCLHNGVSLIGRGDDQAIKLDFGDNSISRNNHASVAFDDESNQFFLGHGGKSNIVRLNKKPVLSTEELNDGDEIRLGETTLRFAAFCNADFGWTDENENGAGNAVNG